MTEKNNGGQAFPTHPILYSSADAHLAQGMSLRDWFAGQALSGIVLSCREDTRRAGQTPAQMFAEKAYRLADAMLAARHPATTIAE